MTLLELFAGSRSIGNEAEKQGLNVFSVDWIPRPDCHNYKYDQQGNVIDKHCHHESARRGAKTGTQGKKGSYNRSKIPNELCREIIESTKLV